MSVYACAYIGRVWTVDTRAFAGWRTCWCAFVRMRNICMYYYYIILELRPILPAVTPLALLALWLAFPAVTPPISTSGTILPTMCQILVVIQ